MELVPSVILKTKAKGSQRLCGGEDEQAEYRMYLEQ